MENKKNSKILILVLVLALASGGGIYAYVSQRQKADKGNETTTEEEAEAVIDDIYGDDLEDEEESESETIIEAPLKEETTVPTPVTNNNFQAVNGPVNFKIDQLKVGGHYNGSYAVSYEITRDGLVFQIAFSSSELSKDHADEAIAKYSRIPKGGTYKTGVSIEQYYQEAQTTAKNNPNSVPTVKKIGDYYYVLAGPQASWSGKDAEVQLSVFKGLQNHFSTLVEI